MTKPLQPKILKALKREALEPKSIVTVGALIVKNTTIIILIAIMSFTVNAADNKPTPSIKCPKAAKGCTSNSINSKCSIMACKAEGCNGDYSSGDCKTLKDLHKAACEFASKKCGKDLPTNFRPNMAVSLNATPMKMAPIKPLSKREFEIRKNRLLIDKKVNKWSSGQPGQFIVKLTVSECTWLGGKVSYWGSCGVTLMKCTAANGREMCIDKVK